MGRGSGVVKGCVEDWDVGSWGGVGVLVYCIWVECVRWLFGNGGADGGWKRCIFLNALPSKFIRGWAD